MNNLSNTSNCSYACCITNVSSSLDSRDSLTWLILMVISAIVLFLISTWESHTPRWRSRGSQHSMPTCSQHPPEHSVAADAKRRSQPRWTSGSGSPNEALSCTLLPAGWQAPAPSKPAAVAGPAPDLVNSMYQRNSIFCVSAWPDRVGAQRAR